MDHYAKRAMSLADSGLSVEYIAEFLCEPVDRIEAVLDGRLHTLDPRDGPVSIKKCKPIRRPFPKLTSSITDDDRIVLLTRHGMSARKIKEYLRNSKTSEHAIHAHARRVLGPQRDGRTSVVASWINSNMRPLIHLLLEDLGKDRYQCEICLDAIPQGCEIHHTKYEGSTIFDLMYVCHSCNMSRENKGLK